MTEISGEASSPSAEAAILFDGDAVPLVTYAGGKRTVVGSALITGHVGDDLRFTATVTDPEFMKEIAGRSSSYSLEISPSFLRTDPEGTLRPQEAVYIPLLSDLVLGDD